MAGGLMRGWRGALIKVLLVSGGLVSGVLILEGGMWAVALIAPAQTPQQQLQRASRTLPAPRTSPACRPEDIQPLGALVRLSPHPDIVYELKPGLDTCLWNDGRVRTNREGIRASREYSQKKRRGVFRLLGLGDSLMFGQGVHNEDVYTRQVEQRLSAKLHRPVEFINLAVPGYNTAIEAAVLAHQGLRYRPDVIVLHWCINDFGVPYFLEHPNAPPLRRARLTAVARRSWQEMLRRLSPRGGVVRQGELRKAPDKLMVQPDLERIPPSYHWMVGVQGVQRALNRIREATATPRKIPVLVIVNYPPNADGAPRKFTQLFSSQGFLVQEVHHPPEWNLSPTDWHPNRQGHAGHADQIIEALELFGLLPS